MAFLPMAVAIIIGAQVSSRLLNRTGARPLLLTGTALMGLGFVGLSRIQPDGSYWVHVFVPGCVISLALGLLFTPLASAATTGVPYTQSGLASGVLNTSRQVGGSLGLAALATIAIDRTHTVVSTHAATTVDAALTDGYARAFEVAAILGFVAFLATFIVPWVHPWTATQSQSAPQDGSVADARVQATAEGVGLDLGTA